MQLNSVCVHLKEKKTTSRTILCATNNKNIIYFYLKFVRVKTPIAGICFSIVFFLLFEASNKAKVSWFGVFKSAEKDRHEINLILHIAETKNLIKKHSFVLCSFFYICVLYKLRYAVAVYYRNNEVMSEDCFSAVKFIQFSLHFSALKSNCFKNIALILST